MVEQRTPPPQPRSGGGYRFDRDEIDAVIRDWERLRDDLADDRGIAEPLYQVDGPGAEFASAEAARRANDSGARYLNANEAMLVYADNYIAKLYAARDSYGTADDDSATTMTTINTIDTER